MGHLPESRIDSEPSWPSEKIGEETAGYMHIPSNRDASPARINADHTPLSPAPAPRWRRSPLWTASCDPLASESWVPARQPSAHSPHGCAWGCRASPFSRRFRAGRNYPGSRPLPPVGSLVRSTVLVHRWPELRPSIWLLHSVRFTGVRAARFNFVAIS